MEDKNYQFSLASSFVTHTNKNIFLTGRAGTGKTTFLKYIQRTSPKKMAVIAPTGVAAINAGGVTIHSFFQLPFGAFLPTKRSIAIDRNISNINSLLSNLRFNNSKRQLFIELELLVIDEVSMLRADMLDAIDTILKHFRNRPNEAFGGVQVLFIGDLYQLPPVVKNDEWEILKEFYKSPFFFDAVCLSENKPIYLELQKIYRQNEIGFINLLNKIRNNQVDYDDLDTLHHYFKPGYQPEADENFITLTSHNAKADAINQTELDKINAPLYAYEAIIKGDFSEHVNPADRVLYLKEGAQIMFTKNDKGEDRRYYNGKIGTISRISGAEIYITFPNSSDELLIEREEWKNIKYQYSLEKDKIEEEELGTFSQFPIRLAWAITIHKSQGLTFEKAIIDAGASFAPGQVYVALSRLTSLNGLVLYSKILPGAISTDQRVIDFSETQLAEEKLEKILEEERGKYIEKMILTCFDFRKVFFAIDDLYNNYSGRSIPDINNAVKWCKRLLDNANAYMQLSEKFSKQLNTIMLENNSKLLNERANSASSYFLNLIELDISDIKNHYNEFKIKQKTKAYSKEVKELEVIYLRKKLQLQQAIFISEGLEKGLETEKLIEIVENDKKNHNIIDKKEPIKAEKAVKGETKLISLTMFKEEKKISEIAILRGMTEGTIEGHLLSFVASGDINLEELVDKAKIKIIEDTINELKVDSSKPIKEKLGENYSWNEIRAVLDYVKAKSNLV